MDSSGVVLKIKQNLSKIATYSLGNGYTMAWHLLHKQSTYSTIDSHIKLKGKEKGKKEHENEDSTYRSVK